MHAADHRVSSWVKVVALVIGSSIPQAAGPLEQARNQYIAESGNAVDACSKRMKAAAAKLLSAYDRQIKSKDVEKDEVRKKQLEGERAAIATALEELNRDGLHDPVADVIIALDRVMIFPSSPREGLVAYYGLNEGLGRRTFDAVSRTPCGIGDATWADVDAVPVLDFVEPGSVISAGSIGLGAEWTALVRARFPIESQGHEWSTLMCGGTGRHHVIISRGGELGVFRDQFFGAGARVNEVKGWRLLVVRASQGKTSFFLDGDLVGTAAAAVSEPVISIGNGPWSTGGNPQNVATQFDGFLLYSRALTDSEIGRLKIGRF